jgi:hypothetical protein
MANKIDPRYQADDYFEPLNTLGSQIHTRFVANNSFGHPEASGAFPPEQWQGDALMPQRYANVPTPQPSTIGDGYNGVLDFFFNSRGG